MKILLVEDDLEISKLLAEFLQENGYEVFCQYDGLHVLDCLRENNIDLILLDIMLPYRNGDTVLTAVRECSTVPIIIISAKGTTQNKIDLLRLGADDYITKPFSLRELEARIVTNIKREERHQQKTKYRFMDEMLIDYSEKIVAIAGHRMEFTKIEYQSIEFLSMHPGQVFDKERIYAQVCGYDAEGDSRTITELVRRIRKKIADYSEKEYIETVWGIGYRWKK